MKHIINKYEIAGYGSINDRVVRSDKPLADIIADLKAEGFVESPSPAEPFITFMRHRDADDDSGMVVDIVRDNYETIQQYITEYNPSFESADIK